jgi:NADH-quinone oxidoreductase subunit M
MLSIPWLSIVLFLPLAVGIVVLLLPAGARAALGRIALIGSWLHLLVGIWIYAMFDHQLVVTNQAGSFQLVERASWIPSLGAEYHLGIDGVSLGLVLLTTFLTPLVISYVEPRLGENARHLLFTILALETALIGVLLSIDLLLFYVFWEAMLIPMYFLIAIWGGERKGYASLKFIVMMMIGSLLMLVGILWVYWWYHSHMAHAPGMGYTFSLPDLIMLNGTPGARIPQSIQMWMFFFFFISFAIKTPLFPFHAWMPDAVVEGPIAFNALLIEVGAYGLLRFCVPLFPDAAAAWTPAIMCLAVVNIIYGGVLAVAQRDLKRFFAYALIAHAGFTVLGIFSFTIQGMQGAILDMINSGIIAAGLFFIADLLYRRRGSRAMADFGGLAEKMPVLFFVFMVVVLGAAGLPGLNGFTSEFLVLLGAIRSNMVSPVFGYVAGVGVVLSVTYLLLMFQRMMYGRRPPELDKTPDLTQNEQGSLWPIVAVVFFIGIASAWLTRPMWPAVNRILVTEQVGLSLTGQQAPASDYPLGAAEKWQLR